MSAVPRHGKVTTTGGRFRMCPINATPLLPGLFEVLALRQRHGRLSPQRDELQTQILPFVKGICALGSLKLDPESLPRPSVGFPEESEPCGQLPFD